MKKLFLIHIVTLLLAVGICTEDSYAPSTSKLYMNAEDTIKCNYFERKEFMNSIQSPKETEAGNTSIRGGIVPHHLVAGSMIASFFSAAAQNPPETIYVLAPNHKAMGSGRICTGLSPWETPFGRLEADKTAGRYLLGRFNAVINTDLLEEDHSISAIVPYIKYYLPEVKIVPLLLKSNLTIFEARRLGIAIGKAAQKNNSLVLASTDFSHYLTAKQASIRDKETLDAIKNWDVAAIKRMHNENIDSPPAVITLLTAMEQIDATNMHLIQHSNSEEILQHTLTETTSYFTMAFSK